MKKGLLMFVAFMAAALLFTSCQNATASAGDSSPSSIGITSVQLDKTTATVVEGLTVTLTASVSPTNATNKTITWTSSDTDVATVDNGVVTGIAAGTATITAACGGQTATCAVTVEELVLITGIDLGTDPDDIETQDKIALTADLTPSGANSEITWTSSDSDVASVDEDGNVIALTAGTVTITATSASDSSITDSVSVTVVAARESYLYKASDGTATADITTEIQPWAGAIEEVSDGSYTKVLKSAYSTWGACVAFQFTSSQLVSYKKLAFDVKIDGDTSIIIKVPEVTKTINLTNSDEATALSDGWYHVSVAIPANFADVYKAATQIGLLNQTVGVTNSTLYITNVKLVGDNGETDDTALDTLIDSCTTLKNDATVGNGSGEYPQADYDTFAAAITAATNGDKTTQANILSLLATLKTAKATFESSRVALFSSFAASPTVDGLYLFNSSGAKTNNVTVTNWNPSWGQKGSLIDEEITIGSTTRTLKKIVNLDYQGIEFTSVDASGMNAVHVSYFTEDGTALDLYPIIGGEYQIAHTVTTKDAWVDHVYYLDATKDHSNTYQFKFVGGGNYYLDNIYFFLDTATLTTEVTNAQALYDGATEGTAIGEYAVGSKATLAAAIAAASAATPDDSTELNTAVTTLKAAEVAFLAGRVNEWAVVPQAGAGAWFKVTFTWTDAGYALTADSFTTAGITCDSNTCNDFMGGATVSDSTLTLPLSMVGADFNVAGNHTLTIPVTLGTDTYTVVVVYTNASEAEGTNYSIVSTSITKN